MSTMTAMPPSAVQLVASGEPILPMSFRDTCGVEVRIREIRPEDAQEIRNLHARCSETTLRRRYFGVSSQVDHLLSWVFDPDQGHCLAAFAQGRLVGLGHLMAPDWTGIAEIAVMVDDAHQGRRIGPSIVDLLIGLGRQYRYPALQAEVTLDNGRMRQILVRRGFSSTPEAGAYTMTRSLG